MINSKYIKFGHSPDADDAFMFYGLASKKVTIQGFEVSHEMHDIETLNLLASRNDIEITAISAAHYPAISDSYRIMSCGASIGRNYGPVVVAAHPMREHDLKGAVIAVPGQYTTSWMLYRLFAPPYADAHFMNFDAVEDAVKSGKVDAGILLHEGQILYEQRSLNLVMDLGKRWGEMTGLPIPLGLDVISRKLDQDTAQACVNGLALSIRYARAHEDEALDYALGFGRGIKKEEARRFIRMYVNEDTEDMGSEGYNALETLYNMAAERGILSDATKIDIIQALPNI